MVISLTEKATLTIGLVINPIAGVGAALAWKGTDDVDAAWDAVAKGEQQPIWDIVNRAISSIPSNLSIEWLFGGQYPINLSGERVYQPPKQSSATDTKKAVIQFLEYGVDLIVFAGGDGTASDVASISKKIPIIGIPGGVKIFSPCFVHRPEDLGTLLHNWDGSVSTNDILDLDENLYREGVTQAKLVTSAAVPVSTLIQSGKVGTPTSDYHTFELIAERIQDDQMLEKRILVGPGSTMHSIFTVLGIETSLLGVDYLVDGKLVAMDCTYNQLQEYRIDEIWLTPIGNQGHIFGRGNRQIPASTIKQVGKKNILVFATLDKIRNTSILFVDTGDPQVDTMLKGYIKVIVGYHDEIVRKIT